MLLHIRQNLKFYPIELDKLSCFLSGLRDEIRLPIRMLNPANLDDAFGLAKIQEQYVWIF